MLTGSNVIGRYRKIKNKIASLDLAVKKMAFGKAISGKQWGRGKSVVGYEAHRRQGRGDTYRRIF